MYTTHSLTCKTSSSSPGRQSERSTIRVEFTCTLTDTRTLKARINRTAPLVSPPSDTNHHQDQVLLWCSEKVASSAASGSASSAVDTPAFRANGVIPHSSSTRTCVRRTQTATQSHTTQRHTPHTREAVTAFPRGSRQAVSSLHRPEAHPPPPFLQHRSPFEPTAREALESVSHPNVGEKSPFFATKTGCGHEP